MNWRRKNTSVYTVLFVSCVIGFWLFENCTSTDTTTTFISNSDTQVAIPLELMPVSDGVLVTHNYYSLSYKEAYEQAEWVGYGLSARQLVNTYRKRPFFIEDPKVKTYSADWRNYKNSGYDRGHLCPAGDRKVTEAAYNETFYTSNITPQKNDFNAGIWNRLEGQVREWAKRYDTVYIFTGGVLQQNLETIGYEDVAVPEQFYKIIIRKSGDSFVAIAFLLPHEETSTGLQEFVVSIDEVESLTNIDFLEQLEEATESALEAEVNMSNWVF